MNKIYFFFYLYLVLIGLNNQVAYSSIFINKCKNRVNDPVTEKNKLYESPKSIQSLCFDEYFQIFKSHQNTFESDFLNSNELVISVSGFLSYGKNPEERWGAWKAKSLSKVPFLHFEWDKHISSMKYYKKIVEKNTINQHEDNNMFSQSICNNRIQHFHRKCLKTIQLPSLWNTTKEHIQKGHLVKGIHALNDLSEEALFVVKAWYRSKSQADIAGKILALFICELHKIDPNRNITLLGYSLGARVTYKALLADCTKDMINIKRVVWIAGAFEAHKTDMKILLDRIKRFGTRIHNVYNPNDPVLQNRYKLTKMPNPFLQSPVGLSEINVGREYFHNYNIRQYWPYFPDEEYSNFAHKVKSHYFVHEILSLIQNIEGDHLIQFFQNQMSWKDTDTLYIVITPINKINSNWQLKQERELLKYPIWVLYFEFNDDEIPFFSKAKFQDYFHKFQEIKNEMMIDVLNNKIVQNYLLDAETCQDFLVRLLVIILESFYKHEPHRKISFICSRYGAETCLHAMKEIHEREKEPKNLYDVILHFPYFSKVIPRDEIVNVLVNPIQGRLYYFFCYECEDEIDFETMIPSIFPRMNSVYSYYIPFSIDILQSTIQSFFESIIEATKIIDKLPFQYSPNFQSRLKKYNELFFFIENESFQFSKYEKNIYDPKIADLPYLRFFSYKLLNDVNYNFSQLFNLFPEINWNNYIDQIHQYPEWKNEYNNKGLDIVLCLFSVLKKNFIDIKIHYICDDIDCNIIQNFKEKDNQILMYSSDEQKDIQLLSLSTRSAYDHRLKRSMEIIFLVNEISWKNTDTLYLLITPSSTISNWYYEEDLLIPSTWVLNTDIPQNQLPFKSKNRFYCYTRIFKEKKNDMMINALKNKMIKKYLISAKTWYIFLARLIVIILESFYKHEPNRKISFICKFYGSRICFQVMKEIHERGKKQKNLQDVILHLPYITEDGIITFLVNSIKGKLHYFFIYEGKDKINLETTPPSIFPGMNSVYSYNIPPTNSNIVPESTIQNFIKSTIEETKLVDNLPFQYSPDFQTRLDKYNELYFFIEDKSFQFKYEKNEYDPKIAHLPYLRFFPDNLVNDVDKDTKQINDLFPGHNWHHYINHMHKDPKWKNEYKGLDIASSTLLVLNYSFKGIKIHLICHGICCDTTLRILDTGFLGPLDKITIYLKTIMLLSPIFIDPSLGWNKIKQKKNQLYRFKPIQEEKSIPFIHSVITQDINDISDIFYIIIQGKINKNKVFGNPNFFYF